MKDKREIIKVTLMGIVVLMLLLSLFDMPYGYYELVRFVVMAVCGYMAYRAYRESNTDRMIVMIVLALLFQPFIKIALGRLIWIVVDILVAIYMGYLIFRSLRKSGLKFVKQGNTEQSRE